MTYYRKWRSFDVWEFYFISYSFYSYIKTQKLSGHDIKTEDFNHQQYHSIESIRNEKNTRFNDSYNSTSHPMHIQSSQHSDNQLQNIYNKTTYSKKKLTENNQGTEPLEEHEILQNDSDQSQNSESSDEDNDSLFQPTSIFEYDIEQPVHQTGGVVMSRDNAMAKNFENLNSMHHEMPQAINSIVTEIKSNLLTLEEFPFLYYKLILI